ncbi:MAG: Uma2 family endonuclease [Microcoleaceae cyanobacterium]
MSNLTPHASEPSFHQLQCRYLSDTFQPPDDSLPELLFTNITKLYFDPKQPEAYKQPDWFVVLGVKPLPLGHWWHSFLPWQESVNPLLVVELLDSETYSEDLGKTVPGSGHTPTKWDVYERILKIPYYIVFEGETSRLDVFQLTGEEYKNSVIQDQRIWIPELELGLGLWQGSYQEINRTWLRWYNAEESWIVPVSNSVLGLVSSPEPSDENQPAAASDQAVLAEKLKQLGLKTSKT